MLKNLRWNWGRGKTGDGGKKEEERRKKMEEGGGWEKIKEIMTIVVLDH